MRARVTVLAALVLIGGAVVAPLSLHAVAPASAADLTPVAATPLYFKVHVDPNNGTTCTITADLYQPLNWKAGDAPAPVILGTNGFGGSKADLAGFAQQFTNNGYGFLAYSGLGFGGSGCKIELDDPDYDGKAASQIIDYLGGKTGNAFSDPALTKPADPSKRAFVQLDNPATFDPRVGMIGKSYGGEVQFATAAVDPRLDTIIPQITWNDLAYSLAPNNDDAQGGPTYPASSPGVEKWQWVSLFFAEGIADGVLAAAGGIGNPPSYDPSLPMVGCPNFDNRACVAKAELDTLGYPTPDTMALAHHASVTSYLSKIKIPTLLSQGQADTLFNLREAIATYQGLKAQGTPVKMIWQHWGHSDSNPAPLELSDGAVNPHGYYDNARYLAWFDHYLKGLSVDTGPDFAWFRDDLPAPATGGLADPRYQSAPRYPAYGDQLTYLSAPAQPGGTPSLPPCGAGSIVNDPTQTQPGSMPVVIPPEVPTSYTETAVVDQTGPLVDAPCTAAVFDGAPVAKNTPIVGVPKVTIHLDAPTYSATQGVSPAGELVLFAKLLDVAPDGTLTLPHRLVSPIRVSDVTKPVTIDLPGIVHLLPAGHHLEFRIAAGDFAYRGNVRPGLVNLVLDPAAPSQLSVPTGPAEATVTATNPPTTAPPTTAPPTTAPPTTAPPTTSPTTAAPTTAPTTTAPTTAPTTTAPTTAPTTTAPTTAPTTVAPTTAAPTTAAPTTAAPTTAAPTTAAPTTAPSSPASATAAPSSSTGPAPTGNGGGASCAAPVLTVLDPEIVPGQLARARLDATPGDQVRIEAMTAPATTWHTARSQVTVPDSGRISYGFVPSSNTKLRAVSAQCGPSAATVVDVHAVPSLSFHRTGPGSYTFSGTVLPGPAEQGVTVNLYEVTPQGQTLLKAQATVHHGVWRLSTSFTGRGRLTVFVRVPTTGTNLSGVSQRQPVVIR